MKDFDDSGVSEPLFPEQPTNSNVNSPGYVFSKDNDARMSKIGYLHISAQN